MKTWYTLLLALGLVLSLSNSYAATREEDAKSVAKMLNDGKYKEISAKFGAELAGKLKPQDMEGPWLAVTGPLGAFDKIASSRQYTLQGNDVVDVKCSFQAGNALVRVIYLPSGEIGGLWVFPLSAAAAAANSQ